MSERYDYSAPFAERAAVSLADPKLRAAVALSADRSAAGRLSALTSLEDPGGLRDHAARLRDAVLARLDEHPERLAQNWEARGGRVFFAADAAEARDYVCSVARREPASIRVTSSLPPSTSRRKRLPSSSRAWRTSNCRSTPRS